MDNSSSNLSFIGIGVGAVALLLALFHFYAGPFSPQPTLEDAIAEKAVAIRDATVAALKGEQREKKSVLADMDADKAVQLGTALLGGIAIILAVIGFAKKESIRAAGGAAILGSGAIAFQFLTIALGAIICAILIAAVLSQIGIDI